MMVFTEKKVGLETPVPGSREALGEETWLWGEASPDPCKTGGKKWDQEGTVQKLLS